MPLNPFQLDVVVALRADIERAIAKTPRSTPQRDYLVKLAADVLRMERQLKDRDGRAIADEIMWRTFDDYLREPDGNPGTFAVFEGLFKKIPGGHFKPVGELRAVLPETFVVIDNSNRPRASATSVH
jgi:hypothetical protein